jgi:hypothetical protein
MSLPSNTKQWIAFGFSAFVGAFVWIASPCFTGQREPWDSLSVFYQGTMLIGGIIAGLFVARRFWLWAVGIWLGQIIGFVWCAAMGPTVGPLAPVGFLMCLPLFSLWGLFGSGVGAAAHILFRRFIIEKRD